MLLWLPGFGKKGQSEQILFCSPFLGIHSLTELLRAHLHESIAYTEAAHGALENQ